MQKIVYLVTILLIISLVSCKEKDLKTEKIITVSVTLPPYADFISQIIGKELRDKIRINTLIQPGTNAHSYEPKPAEIKNLLNSKIYFRVGNIFNLEKTLFEKVNFKKDSTKIIDCSKNINLIDNNPHYWLSPQNAKLITQTILDQIILLMPEFKDQFTSNYNKFISKIDSINQIINQNLKHKKNLILFVYHPAWTYFAKDFNLTELSIETEGKSPNALELNSKIILARQKNIKTIFYDPHFDKSAAYTIAKSLNVNLDTLDPLPTDYIKNLIEISEKLKNGLM